ncbi:tyrosine-type recombinase/integrase [Sphingomonas sp. DBB INV C78]|uniref:tyrosine-type recombinase/integrase n=1 Tax=Sphingomonas sp. DBB INV C78 TaxID=3349434 RepID=UPI0036D3A7C3
MRHRRRSSHASSPWPGSPRLRARPGPTDYRWCAGSPGIFPASSPAPRYPPAGIFPAPRRTPPYIYTEEEIERLLEATLSWGLAKGINRQTYQCLFGLLAATGMRLGEAIGLARADVDLEAGILTLREAKGGKDRLVPLHPTTTKALADYAARRDDYRICRKSGWFFVLRGEQRLRPQYAERVFMGVTRRIGLRDSGPHSRGPRLHDFRHSFAVSTLLRWYREGEDVECLLPTFTTYLGHSKVRDTYWYLSPCPELMNEAASRLEARWGTGHDGRRDPGSAHRAFLHPAPHAAT